MSFNADWLRRELEKRVDKSGGCWIWNGSTNGRYGRLSLKADGKWRSVYAHRLSLFLDTGLAPVCVRHTCDNTICVRPSHLLAGTQLDNCADMIARGRMPRGEKRGNVRLTDESVREMRIRRSIGREEYEAIASKFGVSKATARDAIIGKTWSHVGVDLEVFSTCF